MLTEEQITQNAHISHEEIIADIKDTQKEIDQYEAENEVLSKDRQRNKTRIYLNQGQILHRQGFINDLKQILEYRLKATKQ